MKRKLFLALAVTIITASCSRYKGIYREGRYVSITRSWKYPELIFYGPGIAGKHILKDTVSGLILERSRFIDGFGLFGLEIFHHKTTTYDTLGNNIKVVRY